jgi:hypothetical protein
MTMIVEMLMLAQCLGALAEPSMLNLANWYIELLIGQWLKLVASQKQL